MESSHPPGTGPRFVRLDGAQIRAMAHPLRSRLLALLRIDGPATATALAHVLHTNTGATSYHLRQLAEVGLVAEDADLGTGRQRFWRAVHDVSTWQATDFDDDPDARAAMDWVEGNHLRLLTEYAERWFAARADYSPAWREAANASDALLTLSPARLRALTDELWQVLQRYRDETPPDETGAEQVLIFFSAFPRMEPGPTSDGGTR